MQIGAMRLFTTVGQNLLDHSLEVSALMGMLAGEMEKDASLARRIGLLHDIGKTLSDDIGGTHAERGSEFLAKFGESHLVVNGVASHHGQIAPLSFEASLCPIADALSASRLGARIDQNEKLLQRIETLERIAHEFPVERAWAFHGGKELALFVESDKVCDTSLTSLSRKLAERIREELKPNLPLRLIITREKKVIEDVF
jgi:uncharacterized domain HDIG